MYHVHIRCRLYSATCTRACQVKVPTSCVAQATNRYPLPESVFDDATMQSYIHDCLVRVHEGKHAYHFRVFFKRHCHLRINQSLRWFSKGHTFRGDALVMRVGTRCHDSVVNMRDRDTILSDYAIVK